MEMAGSKAIISATTSEDSLVIANITPTTINQPNANVPPGEMNFGIDVPPWPYMILPPPRTRIVRDPPLGVPTPFPVEIP